VAVGARDVSGNALDFAGVPVVDLTLILLFVPLQQQFRVVVRHS
jgi:hypothetical protein